MAKSKKAAKQQERRRRKARERRASRVASGKTKPKVATAKRAHPRRALAASPPTETSLPFPSWACKASYTRMAAEAVAQGLPLPGVAPPEPHHVAKLEALLGLAPTWGLIHVRQLSDEELVQELVKRGAPHLDKAELRRRAEGWRSAWRLGASLVGSPGHDDARALGAITTELWRRWLPDIACYESVCDRIQMAYPLLDGTGRKPIPEWMVAFRELAALLPDTVRSIEAANAETGMLQTIWNWLGDMSNGVMNVARATPSFIPEALAFVRWVQHFDDADIVAYATDEAELLMLADRSDEAIRLMEAFIAKDPDAPGPYARLAYILETGSPGTKPDLARAAEVLREAMARPVRDIASWDIELMLQWIEEKIASS